MGQYPDRLWGPFIVHDPTSNFPYTGRYDYEIIITLTDWYYEEMVNFLQMYGSIGNKASDDGDEPTPDAALFDVTTDAKIHVEPNKTYLIGLHCVGNFPGHAFPFDQHEMTVVEVDGIWIEEALIFRKHPAKTRLT